MFEKNYTFVLYFEFQVFTTVIKPNEIYNFIEGNVPFHLVACR